MAIYAVGDSIASGLGNAGGVTAAYATPGISLSAMGAHFAEVRTTAVAGDTIIISAGYNGNVSREQLTRWIEGLPEGVNVAILGLREQGLQSGPYPHLDGATPERNAILREVAAATGAVFVEESIALANNIPRGEIHPNQYQPFLLASQRAITAAAEQAAAEPETPAAETPAEETPATETPAEGEGEGTGTPDATGEIQRDGADAGEGEGEGEEEGMWDQLAEMIGQIITALFGWLSGGTREDGEQPAATPDATPGQTPTTGETPANGEQPTNPITPEVAEQAAGAVGFQPATGEGGGTVPTAPQTPAPGGRAVG